MKHFVKNSIAVAVVGAAVVAGSAVAGIANTRHNLGSSQAVGSFNRTSSTGEICIFCHTPHGGDTGAAVPLWNKRLSTATYTTYDVLGTSTLDAGVVTPIGSVSLACLTCHDGTQAIDNIRNAPGSGGFDAAGGGPTGLGWSWTSPGSSLDANGQFVAGPDTGGTNITTIGTDLRNDHPISVQYGGGGVTSAGGTTVDQDFFQPIAVGSGASIRWYVQNTVTGNTGGFDKWDFKLYTRNITNVNQFNNPGAPGAQVGIQPFVECGSCHDPHFETTTFLRMPGTVDGTSESNTGSRVCLTCHDK